MGIYAENIIGLEKLVHDELVKHGLIAADAEPASDTASDGQHAAPDAPTNPAQ